MIHALQKISVDFTVFQFAKATGPDGLGNRVLRELSKELSVPYCSLFNESLSVGIVPSLYKEANVLRNENVLQLFC